MSENSDNGGKPKRTGRKSSTGYPGVYARPYGWYRAMVWTAGKGKSLGSRFKSPELAAAAIARYQGDEGEARRLEEKAGVFDSGSVTRRATPAELAYAGGYLTGSIDREICTTPRRADRGGKRRK